MQQGIALTLLLQNLFNAPWPKEFNASGFMHPNRDMDPIQDSKVIKDFTLEDKESMADALVWENQDIMRTPFGNVYLFPIKQIINP